METYQRTGDLTLSIGDELYFESLSKDVDLYSGLIFDESFKNAEIKVVFHEEDENIPAAVIHVYPAENGPVLGRFEGGIAKKTSYNKAIDVIELGCDTASYLFNGDTINTMADGYYGTAVYAKDNDEALIEITGGYLAETMEEFKAKILHGLGIEAN